MEQHADQSFSEESREVMAFTVVFCSLFSSLPIKQGTELGKEEILHGSL